MSILCYALCVTQNAYRMTRNTWRKTYDVQRVTDEEVSLGRQVLEGPIDEEEDDQHRRAA